MSVAASGEDCPVYAYLKGGLSFFCKANKDTKYIDGYFIPSGVTT